MTSEGFLTYLEAFFRKMLNYKVVEYIKIYFFDIINFFKKISKYVIIMLLQNLLHKTIVGDLLSEQYAYSYPTNLTQPI